LKGQGHHKKTIEALPLCLDKSFAEIADQIEIASRQRGQAMYDRVGVVEEQDAADLLNVATELRAALIVWIKTKHPNLLPTKLR
jgi:hypothetical protein